MATAIASPIAVDSSRSRPSTRRLTRLAVERRFHLDSYDAGERHEADLDVVVDLVDEVAGRVLGRLESVGSDVGRLHRQ